MYLTFSSAKSSSTYQPTRKPGEIASLWSPLLAGDAAWYLSSDSLDDVQGVGELVDQAEHLEASSPDRHKPLHSVSKQGQ
jgi:hypothetical protein